MKKVELAKELIAFILMKVCEHFKISPSDIADGSKRGKYTSARRMTAFLLKKTFGLSAPVIAKALIPEAKNSTMVYMYVRTVNQLTGADKKVMQKISEEAKKKFGLIGKSKKSGVGSRTNTRANKRVTGLKTPETDPEEVELVTSFILTLSCLGMIPEDIASLLKISTDAVLHAIGYAVTHNDRDKINKITAALLSDAKRYHKGT